MGQERQAPWPAPRRRGSWSGSEGTGSVDNEDDLRQRRSLAGLFGSLGKGGRREPDARKAADKRRSQFYVELPVASTCVDEALLLPHHPYTRPATSGGPLWPHLLPARTADPDSRNLRNQHSPHPTPVDAPGAVGRVRQGVLVLPDALRSADAYRRRAQQLGGEAELVAATMGGIASRSSKVEVASVSVAPGVTQQYGSVLAELTGRLVKAVNLRFETPDGDDQSSHVDEDEFHDCVDHLGDEVDCATLKHQWLDAQRTAQPVDQAEGHGQPDTDALHVEDVTCSKAASSVWCVPSFSTNMVGVWCDPESSAAAPLQCHTNCPHAPCVPGVQCLTNPPDPTPTTPHEQDHSQDDVQGVISQEDGLANQVAGLTIHEAGFTSQKEGLTSQVVDLTSQEVGLTSQVVDLTNPEVAGQGVGDTNGSDASPAPSPELTCREKRERKVFNIARELMTSEQVFVDVLRLLNEDLRCAVAQHDPPLLPADDLNKILNYLPQLQNLNEELLADLEARIADWERQRKVSDVLVRKGPFLKLYSSYISEFQSQCDHLEHCCQIVPAFAAALRDFEASPRCNKLQVRHYMLKPVQRIPQYRLLLEEYLKFMPQDHPDFLDTQTALAVVANVAAHANDTMKQGSNFMKVLALQDRLGCGGGEGPRYEVVRPGRCLIKEGELLKLCRREMQPRYFILLSDVLLYTSQVSSSAGGALRLHCDLQLEGMRVETPKAEDFKNEFSVISTSRSFTLQASSAEERDGWIRALREVIEDNACRRSTFQQAKVSSYQQPAASSLGKQAPVWIPDYRVTMCQQCTAEFTLTFRRHHCRACGKVVCDPCSSNRAPLQYNKYQAVRVCDACFEVLQQDFERHCGAPTKEGGEDGASATTLRSLRSQFKRGDRDHRTKKKVPDRLREVSGSDTSSQMCGYLRVLLRRSWRRGWFVLKDRVLYEYRAPQDVCALYSLPILGYHVLHNPQVQEVDVSVDDCLAFQLTHPNQPALSFQADSPHLAQKWIEAMREAVVLT